MITVSDLIEYRLKNESLITLKEQQDSFLAGFKAQKFIFEDHNQIQHIAFCFNQPRKSENIKFHISGSDFELLTSNKFSQLLEQIQFLSQNGGIIIFMQGEKSNAAQFKNYGIGAQILRFFKVEEVHLMSQNCDKDFIALKGFGLDIKTCQFKNLL